MKRRFCILMFMVMSLYETMGQPPQSQSFLPKVLPSSPEASNLGRYGSIPVNLYTGIPDISIPLYEIKLGDLRVPISLSYHASGNKVTDNPSRVGLGWSLSAGGSIGRRMMGKPDEQEGNYLSGVTSKSTSEINTSSTADLNYLWNITQGTVDAEPDIFSYSFPGKSGKFVFNQRDNFKPIIFPYDPLVISRTHPNQSTMLFSILDESGNKYDFNDLDWTSNSSGSSNLNAISNWSLTRMISSNKEDTIEFKYLDATTSDSYFSESIVVNDNVQNYTSPAVYQQDFGNGYLSFSYITTWGKVNSEILFKGGKVVFEEALEAREDFNSSTLPKRLKSIKIFSYDFSSNTYSLIKTITFYHSYFITGNDNFTKRLKLDSIGIGGNNGVDVERYRFEYNTSVGLPGKDSKKKDYWGYFNNKDNNSLIPRMEVPYITPTGTTTIWVGSIISDGREPDPNYSQAWIIDKLIYPTGGWSKFEFENNSYADQQNTVKYAGGLRVKKITNYSNATTIADTRTYKYGLNEVGYGRPNFQLNNYFFQTSQNNRFFQLPGQMLCPQVYATKRVRTFLSNPTIDIEPYDGSTVGYAYVTEYVGDELSNQGRTKYQFNDQPDALNLVAAYGRPIFTTYHFNRGQVIEKLVQKYTSKGFVTVTKTNNIYEYFPEQLISFLGLAVKKLRINDSPNGSNIAYGPINSGACPAQEDTYSYQYDNYSIRLGDNRLKESTEVVYDDLVETRYSSNTTKYYYDNFNHQQLTRVETTNSAGDIIVTTKSYPHEFSAIAPYNLMVSNNILNKVVEEKTTSNGILINQVNNNYDLWGSNNFLIRSINLKVQNNPSETKVLFNSYNSRGGVLQVQKIDDSKINYIWDYQNTLPIAEITNADESEIAYTSFESNGKGNWTFTGSIYSDPTAISGNRVYDLSTGSITKVTGLNNTRTYFVSYWTKNSIPFTISGTTGVVSSSGNIINGWRNFVHQIVNSTSISISGTGLVDELRLYPDKSFVNTMVHQPMVGVTQKIDHLNNITFYEYDLFGRLSIIRDQDRNVIRKIQYAYSGESQGDAIFPNAAQSASFTRNNCTAGWVGSTTTYTVPAGTYKSAVSVAEANNQALAAVNANGQAYANGGAASCMPTVSSINTSTTGFSITLTNTSTSAVYTYSIPVGSTSTQLGGIPIGTYTIQITQAGTTSVQTTFNGSTQTGTSFSYSNVNIAAPVTVSIAPAPVPCTFAFNAGYNSISNSFTSSNGVVSFYMAFYRTTTMTAGNTYFIGTINGGCRPSTTRSITFSSSGRTWTITIYANGQMHWYLMPGSATVNSNSVISCSTQTFNQ